MYVPCELGFWDNVFTKTFCQQTKNPRGGEAIMRLREFIMLDGNNVGALPKKYQIEHIRSRMGVDTSTKALSKALAANHFLRRRRQTWYYPDWKETAMGGYCKERLRQKEAKAALRARAHAAALERIGQGDDEETSQGRTGDIPVTSSGKSALRNGRRPADAPPAAPEGGVEGEALTRWGWFKDLHPRLRNPPLCKRMLAKMTPEEWEQLQFALPRQAPIYMSRGRKFIPPSDKYLRDQHFWELRKETPRKPVTKTDAKKAAKKAAEEDPKVFAYKFLMELLADHGTGLDERDLKAHHKKQQQAKDHWEKTYGDRPWEKGSK